MAKPVHELFRDGAMSKSSDSPLETVDPTKFVPGSRVGATHGKSVSVALEMQFSAALAPGALSTKDKLLLLGATCAARRRRDPAREAFRRAINLGATEHEIEEILLACFVSRGALAYLEGRAIVAELFDVAEQYSPEDEKTSESGDPATSTRDILDKYLRYFTEPPLWVQSLAEYHPQFFAGHQLIRELVFTDGYVRRTLKELVFVAINSVEQYPYGIQLHLRAATAAGATKEEIFETLAVAALEGGIVTWIEAIHYFLGEGIRY